jgi:RNA polymerase sigma factor (sigma-70 family)
VRRAIVHAHASRWRRRWRGEISTSTLPGPHGDVDLFAAADERRVVLAALLTLPVRQRATLILRYYEDLTEVETAATLGCSVGTVKSQTVKALSSLRRAGVLLANTHHAEVAHD